MVRRRRASQGVQEPDKEARRRDSTELDRGSEAEETGQVCANLHGSRDHQGNRVDDSARPPVLGTEAWEINTRTRAQGHRSPVLGRPGPVLLSDSEDVQGELVPSERENELPSRVSGPRFRVETRIPNSAAKVDLCGLPR